jgi:hypothetical protein
MVIQLDPEIESALRAEADMRGVSLHAIVTDALRLYRRELPFAGGWLEPVGE